MTENKQESLLGGCRVLDLTDEKGFLCGKILGDFGADVIKIERPGGDPARNKGPFYKDIVDPEKSLHWFHHNLNKRSITLDIEKVDGREIFIRLVRTADFVIESFDPGYMEDLGLGYEDLEALNPRVIMTSITPFGRTGPHKDFKHSDISTWAMGGYMRLCGDMDRAPVRMLPQTAAQAGTHAALGTMTAHYFRELSGEGQHVDVSIQQTGFLNLMITSEYWDILKVNVPRSGSSMPFPRKGLPPLILPYILPCKDGYVTISIFLGTSPVVRNSNNAIIELMRQDGMAGALEHDAFTSYSAATTSQEEYDALMEPVKKWLLTQTKAELYDVAIRNAILIAPVNNVEDVAQNEQLRARDYWSEVVHPELNDQITYPGATVRLSACPCKISRRPPLIGEHNKEIYEDELGFSNIQMEILKAHGIL